MRDAIYIVGLGLRAPDHVTRETERILRRSRCVYYMHPDRRARRYLRALCPKVVNLFHHYGEGKDRDEIYGAIADEVIGGAKRRSPVTMAMPGHPRLLNTPTQMVLDRAPKNGVGVKMLPGISSFDGLLVDLNIDPVAGLQAYMADSLILDRIRLRPDIPCLIWNPAGFGSARFTFYQGPAGRFRRLREYLLKFYPRNHKAIVARCAVNSQEKPRLRKIALARLDSAQRELDGIGTLYIPPSATRRRH